MDKFAVLQLRKKQEKAAARAALGLQDGDILVATKQEMTEAQLDTMNASFGYLNAPDNCFALSREGSAALWWNWKNPHPVWTPLDLGTSTDRAHQRERDRVRDREGGGEGAPMCP